MTRLLVDPATDFDDPAAVTLTATLLDPGPALVRTFTGVDAATVVDLPAPGAAEAWRLTIRRPVTTTTRWNTASTNPGPIVAERTVRWTGSGPVAWAALTDVDPATLRATATSRAAWDAAIAELRAEVDALPTGGSGTGFSGNYADLTGKPAIPVTPADIGAEPAGTTDARISALVDGAPDALNTLKELAAQLTTDEGAAAGLAAAVAGKEPAGLSTGTRAALDASYSPLARVPTVAVLGHSMPYQAGGLYTYLDSGSRYYPDDSYLVYAQALSGGRWMHDGTEALSGASIQDVLATHLPALLARPNRPDYCVVHVGQNDVSTLSGQDFTDLAAIYAMLRGAGVEPIAVTEVASVTAPGATWRLNQWITRHAREHGITLVDFYAATVDPATGTYFPGYSGDGIHPTGPGAYACGQALADALTARLPDVGTTALLARTDLAAVAGTLLIGVPTFQTDDGGPPPVTAPWQVRPSGSTFAAVPGVPGRAWALTTANGAGNADSYAPFTPAVSAGDRLLVGFKLSTEVEAVGGSWQIELQQTDTGGPHFHIGGTRDVPWSVFAFELVVPAGIPNLRMQPRASGPNGAALRLAQLTIMNLTTQAVL